jgi:RND family efflux transporter MFP subunit
VSSGDFVDAGKTELATIVSQGLLHADVEVDEATAQRIEHGKLPGEGGSGCSVNFGVRNEEGFPHSASIDFVDPEVQATNTVRLRLLIPDPSGSFRPGLWARVRINLSAPREAILIPEKAIGADPGGQRYIFVLNDKNIVEFRFVKVGQLYDNLLAVETGLRADEWVVLTHAGTAQLGAEVPADNIDRLDTLPQAAEKPPGR